MENEKKERRFCILCKKRLMPVGNARCNGKDHIDWSKRMTHKKCWKEYGCPSHYQLQQIKKLST